jgi:hypothetical protein
VGFTGWDNETLNAYFHSHIPRAVSGSSWACITFGLPCLDRTDSASFVQSQALPRNVRWLCWLEQALVAMLRI